MRQRGATLIELVVALALVSIVFMAAAPLVVQSARLFGAAGRTLADPDVDLIGAWLRRDVHRADSITSVQNSEEERPEFVLGMQDGTLVTWKLEGDSLVRMKESGEGEVLRRIVVLQRVRSWSWFAAQGCLNVSLGVGAHIDPGKSVLFEEVEKTAGERSKTVDFCFSLRGAGGRSW